MSAGSMRLFSSAVSALLDGSRPGLLSADISAHLLKPDAPIDAVNLQSLADLSPHLLDQGSVPSPALEGKRLHTDEGGNVYFNSDPILFGSYLTTPPFRYLLFAFGLPGQLPASKPLLGFVDLSTDGGALEVVRDTLVITPSAGGWFQITI